MAYFFSNFLQKAYEEGIYADTPTNRKLDRVGKPYDYKAKEGEKSKEVVSEKSEEKKKAPDIPKEVKEQPKENQSKVNLDVIKQDIEFAKNMADKIKPALKTRLNELKNSLVEGHNLLRAGLNASGKKLSEDERDQLESSVISTRRKMLDLYHESKSSKSSEVQNKEQENPFGKNEVTADDMLNHPTTKAALRDVGWGTRYLAKTKNYEPNTFYRVEGTGLGYTGAGQGMYVGRDKNALKSFYDMENEGFKVVKFQGKPKWLNLMDPKEHDKFEKEAEAKYGKDDPNIANHFKKLAQEKGYDGIQYYDAYATGEEFVLFNTKELKEVK